jgi:hypothetical protein
MKALPGLYVPLDHATVYEHSQIKGAIGVMDDFLTPTASKARPQDVAIEFTKANEELVPASYELGNRAHVESEGGAVVQPGAVARSPGGYHVQLEQSCHGIPVYGGRATVHMTKERNVYFYVSDLQPQAPEVGPGAAQEVTSQEALEVVAAQLEWRDRLESEPCCRRIYLAHEGELRLAWCIDLCLQAREPIHESKDRASDWRALVDAHSAQLLDLRDLSQYNQAWAWVFYPNPVVTLRQADLSHDAQIPDRAYRKVRLAGLDKSGLLRGKYADTAKTLGRVHEPSRQFLYKRGQRGFPEVMAYCFVSRVMNWLRRLGWGSIFSRPLHINARAAIGDHSKFLPSRWEVRFGQGKVLDAEDASIILHELGHAIQEAQVPGWADCAHHMPVRAMGEGFCDWLATLYFTEQRRSFHPTYVGDWDARGYPVPSAFVRRVDTAKTLDNWAGEEHTDGEIWSAALWDLYMQLGGDSSQSQMRREAREAVLELVLTSHLYLSDGMRETLRYGHGLDALLKADRFTQEDVTRPGPHHGLIRDVFERRRIEVA